MNNLIKKYNYKVWFWYEGDSYYSAGYYWDYWDLIDQVVQMGGSSSTVLFKK